MRQIIALVLVCLARFACAQEWSGGVRVELSPTLDQSGTMFVVGGATYNAALGNVNLPLRPGLFVRYDHLHWLLQADAQHANFTIGARAGIPYGSESGLFIKAKQTTFRLVGGYKPTPWMRLNLGLGINLNSWKTDFYSDYAAQLESQINNGQSSEYIRREAQLYRAIATVAEQYKPVQLTAQAGVGFDAGGLSLDLVRVQGLTSILSQVPGALGEVRQNYGFYGLQVGYRILPLKRFLLATRKNRAYERLKRDIPFYRNEFQVGLGILAQDIGSGVVYENRYTRYLTRRFGLTGSVGMSRTDYRPDNYPNRLRLATVFQASVMARLLPLYTRRHQIGLSCGMNVMVPEAGLTVSSGNANGVSFARLSRNTTRTGVGFQYQFDYQVSLTDRLPVGLWLRGSTNLASETGSVGIQTGYRF